MIYTVTYNENGRNKSTEFVGSNAKKAAEEFAHKLANDISICYLPIKLLECRCLVAWHLPDNSLPPVNNDLEPNNYLPKR